MFWPERQQLRVFAHLAPVDMRKQRHGLAALAQNVMAQDPCSGALFIFIGKGRDKLKILSFRSKDPRFVTDPGTPVSTVAPSEGELFGKPRIVEFARPVTPEERGRYYAAVAEAIDRCSQMPFTEQMGGAVAGRVFRVNFIDMRNRKQAEVPWPTEKS